MNWSENFGVEVVLQTDASTETHCQKQEINGICIESVRRGVHNYDFMACISGRRDIWEAGSTRQEAIDSLLRCIN